MDSITSDSLTSGLFSASIGVIATYSVSYVISTSDLTWALIAVAFASFFSGFFSRYFANE